MVILVTEKHQKQSFIQINLLFLSLNSVTLTFRRNACFAVILTSSLKSLSIISLKSFPIISLKSLQ